MSDQERTAFNFWWPTSEIGGMAMSWALVVVGVLSFIKGSIDEELLHCLDSDEEICSVAETAGNVFQILLFYSLPNSVGWYFIFNIGRFVFNKVRLAFSRIRRSKTVRTMWQTRREESEVKALRRKLELKQLREQLGDDDRKEQT